MLRSKIPILAANKNESPKPSPRHNKKVQMDLNVVKEDHRINDGNGREVGSPTKKSVTFSNKATNAGQTSIEAHVSVNVSQPLGGNVSSSSANLKVKQEEDELAIHKELVEGDHLGIRNRRAIPVPARQPSINNNFKTSTSTSVMRLADARRNERCPINSLEDKPLNIIFSYLNHTDLILCRMVQQRWNTLITSLRQFLEKTVFVVNIVKSYNVAIATVYHTDLTSYAHLPFQHARFQFIDHQFLKDPARFIFRNSDNEKYFPQFTFLQHLKTLEFRSCFLCWQTIKRMLVKAVGTESLIITNCHISDTVYKTTSSDFDDEFDEFNAGNAIFGLRQVEVFESRCLANITTILKKFSGYANQNLTSVKITYYPPANRDITDDDSKPDCIDFCRELKAIISLSANTLQELHLDIQHEDSLNLIANHVCKELEALGSRMDLKTFVLSPSLNCWVSRPELIPNSNIAITRAGLQNQKCNMNGIAEGVKAAATSLARFLESQENLEVLAVPCFEYPDAYSPCYKSVLERIPAKATLKRLAVPSAGYLPGKLMHTFANLNSLKVGGSCCQDFTSGWDIFQYYSNEHVVFDTPRESDQNLPVIISDFEVIRHQPKSIQQLGQEVAEELEMLKRMKELCITTSITPDKFKILVKSLSNLTSLDISSGADLPVINDADIQACIKYLKMLKSLLIGCCDNITDFGITGIPQKYCQVMFKNQKYGIEGVRRDIWDSKEVHGRPLSDLKGLRKLILMGSRNTFTDIGIAYGLVFKELKHCHLPYSECITSWGIERFGKMNPSLESFGLCGVSQLTKDAFLGLRRSHARIKKGDASRSGYFMEQRSPIAEDFSLVLPSPENFKEIMSSLFSRLHPIFSLFSPTQGVDVEAT